MTNTHNQNGFARDYIDVATRIAEFRRQYPTGSLRPTNVEQPIRVVTIGDKTFLEYVAAAYRTPDDACPGVGIAWEPFPGKTPFTRDSEAANAETSAWGRAIVAALAADTKHGVASLDEVENARARNSAPTAPVRRSKIAVAAASNNDDGEPIVISVERSDAPKATEAQVKKIAILRRELALDDETYRDRLGRLYGAPSSKELTVAQASDLIEKLNAAAQKRSA
jgi:hypothetical protein